MAHKKGIEKMSIKCLHCGTDNIVKDGINPFTCSGCKKSILVIDSVTIGSTKSKNIKDSNK